MALLWTTPAHAEEASASATYQQAVEEAVSEYNLQHYPEARALFLRAHRLAPNARTLRALGLVAFELREYGECLDYLDRALAETRRPLTREQRVGVEKVRARARRFVAGLTLALRPRETRVRVDGKLHAHMAGRPFWLDMGEHELLFEAPRHRKERRSIVVHGGETETWSIDLVPLTLVPRPALDEAAAREVARAGTSSDARTRSHLGVWQKTLGFTALALGAAGLVTAGALAKGRSAEGRELRETPQWASSAYRTHAERWQDARVAPYALAALGAAASASGALGLALAAERSAFPAWAAGIVGAAGAALAIWGSLEIARGGSCAGEEDIRRCVLGQEQRDFGALLLLAAAPPLTLALVQLTRVGVAPVVQSSAGGRVRLDARFARRALRLGGSWQW